MAEPYQERTESSLFDNTDKHQSAIGTERQYVDDVDLNPRSSVSDETEPLLGNGGAPTSISMTAKSVELLSMFNGKWELDTKRSDPLTAMLEALKVPYFIRKLAASAKVEQTITVVGQNLELKNKTTLGSSAVVHILNGGQRLLTDSKGEQTLDETIVDDAATYPLIIRAVLPKDQGFTTDSRRIIGDEMQQMFEFQVRRDTEPIVMRRYWKRLSSAANQLDGGKVQLEVTLSNTAASKQMAVAEVTIQQIKEPVQIALSSKAPEGTSLPHFAGSPTSLKHDWPTAVLLLMFFTSAWARSDYLDCFIWLSLLILLRSNVIFPSSLVPGAPYVDWWLLPNAKFAATAASMLFGTRVILDPLDDILSRAMEAFIAVTAYAWTRRSDIMQTDLYALFQVDSTTTVSRAWVEACVTFLVCSFVLWDLLQDDNQMVAGNDYVPFGGTIIFSIGLASLARYRVYVIQKNRSQISSPMVTDLSATMSRGGLNVKTVGATSSVAALTRMTPMIVRVKSSRIARYTKRPLAQYLAEVQLTDNSGPYLVWCRYRDLKACADEIDQLYAKEGWGSAPIFPPKRWDSTSEAVLAEREDGLDKYFHEVFDQHGSTVLGLASVKKVFQIDEPRSKIFEEIRTAASSLSKAKHFCEASVAIGEADGWILVKPNTREYIKSTSDGNVYFKSVNRYQTTPRKMLENIVSRRASWDGSCLEELVVRRIRMDMEDVKRIFGGANLLRNRDYITVTRITRKAPRFGAIWNARPHSAILFQCCLEDDRIGRLLFLETSVPSSMMVALDGGVMIDARVEIDMVRANAFILDPLAGGNQTLVTAIRAESNVREPFALFRL